MYAKCSVCQSETPGGIIIGGTIVCRECEPILRGRIDAIRQSNPNATISAAGIAREIYSEQFAGSDYLLRTPPKDLMDAVKHRAVDDGDSIRDIIIRALRAYVM